MCITLYPVSQNEQIELQFVLHSIYLRRDGGATMVIDLLVRNTGRSSVQKLRFMLPHTMLDSNDHLRHTKKILLRDEIDLKRFSIRIRELRERQIGRIQLKTEQLSTPDDPSNWMYHSLEHLNLCKQKITDGVFAITRTDHQIGENDLVGYLKRRWEIKHPTPEIDDWTWFLYTHSNISIFDIEVSDQYGGEHLHPNQSMWLRMRFSIHCSPENQHPWLRKAFSRTLPFYQIMRCPKRLATMAVDHVAAWRVDDMPVPKHVAQHIAAAKSCALRLLPSLPNRPSVKDYRIFSYREYGLTVDSIAQRAALPFTPTVATFHELPVNADDKDCRRGPVPKFLQGLLARSPRRDECFEFWFGEDHQRSANDGYMIEIKSHCSNVIYTYLAWLGFFGFILSVINLIFRFTFP